MTTTDIASVCHEANRAYCLTHGDTSQPPWHLAAEWQRQSVINGVQFHLDNPDASPNQSHDNWLKEKEATGWKYGKAKDLKCKEHPCCVPYDELPKEQKAKDALFKAIIGALCHLAE